MDLHLRRIGGPTVTFVYGGLVVMTDPTFDPPGRYEVGSGLTKTAGPSRAPQDLEPVDVVLLSHDQHPDNLDEEGRKVLADAPLALTTEAAAERLGAPARALPTWTHARLDRRDGAGQVRVTAVPAVHGPDGPGLRAVTERLAGPVTGFLLEGDGLPTLYVSGDNASLCAVREIAGRFGPIDAAILFGGAARTALVPANLTLDAAGMVEAARILRPRRVYPVHVDGWAHFTEAIDDVRAAFDAAGETQLLA